MSSLHSFKPMGTHVISQNKYNLPSDVYQEVIEETKRELIQEIYGLERLQKRAGGIQDPYVQNIIKTALPSNATGNLEDIIQKLDNRTRSKIQSWLNILASDQSKGFLYGVGAATLLSILLPSSGQKIPSAAPTTQEGLGLIERVRSIAEKIKEEIEDIAAEASYNQLKQEIDKELKPNDKYPITDKSGNILH